MPTNTIIAISHWVFTQNQFGRTIAPGAFGVIILDGAGWHQTGGQLVVPANLALLHLPPYSPEPNPVANVWQYLRQNFLSNHMFENYETIVDACCNAWNALMALPERIRSITQRDWAKSVTAIGPLVLFEFHGPCTQILCRQLENLLLNG